MSFSILLPGRSPGGDLHSFSEAKKRVSFSILLPGWSPVRDHLHSFSEAKKKRAVFVTSRIIVTRYCLCHFVPVNIDIPRRGMGYLRGQNKSFI